MARLGSLRARRGSTAGFSLVELMIVVVITSMLALLAAPRFTALSERSALRSSRMQIEAAIATARASAIQKGRPATFWVTGSSFGVRVEINDAGATTVVIPTIPLDSLHKVTLTRVGGVADSVIVFNSRGFASPRLSQTGRYRLTIGSRTDSTCVSTLGHILGQTCAQ